ncbi:GDSL-type esterase/lipase family protein [Limnohabitans sp. 15K]|uniref:GDSL-type esterase/lipase family protein n=1 Tax=Limnohabitans sp. 15K TaxID=1100706 RepID=UPI000C1E231A|nr:GDSL-type esterase/lipase family protein [Limnohabitans sp. 15K]
MTAAFSKFAITVAMAIATASWPVSTLAGPDMALLRVTGQGNPTEFNCPASKSRQLANRSTNELTGPSEGDVKPWTQTPLPPANAYPSALKIGLWGDSHTASGTFADNVLEALRLPLAQTHPSFIAPTFGLKGVRQPLRRACLSDDWQLALAYRTPKEGPENYAKSLSAIHTDQVGAFMWLDFRYPSAQTRVKWADIHLGKDSGERGLVLGVSVDDGVESLVQLPPGSLSRLRVQAELPFASLKLRVVAGAVRIDGIAPVYEGKTPVVMDVFSIPGATAKGWRVVNKDHLRREDPLANGYDVVILQSGTNESLDPDFKVRLYEQQISASLAKLKAAYPRARCILIGPPDAQKSSTTVRLINDTQYRLGLAQGCAHWHWQKAMGGPGAAQRWQAKGWMQADLLHLTPEGYAQSARSFVSMVPVKPR